MPAVTDLHREARSPRFFIDRDGVRGGPFAAVLDADQILDAAAGRRGRLTLRRGRVHDPFLRSWILSGESTLGDVVELSVETQSGILLARWTLSELQILEVSDRRRRDNDDPRFDYILLQVLAIPDELTRTPSAR